MALLPFLASFVSGIFVVSFVANPLFDSVIDSFPKLQLWPLALALACVPVFQWVRAWRFSLLLNSSFDRPSWLMFKLAAQVSFLNLVLPFKIGEFSFPLLARRIVGAKMLQATGAILWCRVADLCVVSGFLMLCGAYLIDLGEHPWYRAMLCVFGLVCLIATPAMKFAVSLFRFWPAFHRILLRIIDRSWIGPKSLVQHVVLTLLIWLVYGLIGYLAASAIANNLSFVAALFASAAHNLAFALPINGVAGLGPPQAAWAAALHLTGFSWQIAVATALLSYGCVLAGVLLTAGLTLFWSAASAPGLAADLDRS